MDAPGKRHRILLGLVAIAALACATQARADVTRVDRAAPHHYLKALLYETQGNLLSAQQEIEKALAIEPNSALLNREAAELAFFLGQLSQAKAAIDRATQIDSSDTRAYLLAGQIYWSLGEIPAAEEKLRRAVELSPDEAQPLVSLAMAVTVRDPNDAIRLYEDFLRRHPDETEIRERLAQLYRSQGDIEKSEGEWKEVLNWNPESLRAHLALAQIAEVASDTHTAISHYEAVLDRDPGNLPLLLRVGELRYRNNEMTEALEAFSHAREIAPDSPSANFWMALLHEHEGEWEKAISYLEPVAASSDEPGVGLRLAYYHTQAGNHGEAIEILEKLTADEPENTDFLNYLAIAYEQVGDHRSALKAVKGLIDIDPMNPEYRFFAATLYDEMDRFSDAEAALRKAIELNPRYDVALNYLGYSYADRNENLEEAEELLMRAIAIEPEKAAYLDSLGWVYFRMGKYTLAEDYLQRAAQKGNDALIWEHLGDVHEARERSIDALLAWDESLRVDPSQTELMRKRRKALRRLNDEALFSLFMKRATANFNDIGSLKGLVTVKVCRDKRCFDSRGEIRYEREKLLRIEVPGPLAGPILLVVKKADETAKFGALHPMFKSAEPMVVAAVERFASVLSGDIFRVVDMVSFGESAKRRRRSLVAEGENLALKFKHPDGHLERVTWGDGTDTLVLGDYQTARYPFLPATFTWSEGDIEIRFEIAGPVVQSAFTADAP